MNRTMIFAACFAASAASVDADTLVFGDSLSDVGRERALLADAWPSAIYPNDQRTDGVTWAEKIGSDAASGLNYAFGGARAVDNGDDRPDFLAQVGAFLADVGAGKDISTVDEVAVWFGGNDFRALLEQALVDPTALSPANVTATATDIITTLVTGIGLLSTTGLTEFVVFGLPDLSGLPAVVNTAFQAPVRDAVEAYDTALQQALSGFNGTGITATFFNIVALSDATVMNANALGLTELTTACVTQAGICADPSSYFFYDAIHPTDTVHSVIAGAYQDFTTPVPLPAGFPLLLSALAVTGVALRSHRSRL